MNHFLLDPPDGFQALDWEKEIRCYRRNMPHWRQTGATYFVTFRLADSLPQQAINQLIDLREEWMQNNHADDEISFRDFAKQNCVFEEAWLDKQLGSCILKRPEIAGIVSEKLRKFHNLRYHLGAYVIMPNHVHIVVRPFDETNHDLDQITRGWKGVSAREINQLTGDTGSKVWQAESFDTIIRNAEHLYEVVQYIGRNPEKAGLKTGYQRWICPEWEQSGYGFTTKW